MTYKISSVYAPKQKKTRTSIYNFFDVDNVVCGTVIPIFGQPYVTSQSNPQSGINVAPGKFGKKNKRIPIYTLYLYY